MVPIVRNTNLLRQLGVAGPGLRQILFFSCLFSLLMLAARVIITGKMLFLFLPWNLFLAAIPYFITSLLVQNPAWIENGFRLCLLFILWLLFIPNSFYILTDLFHLEYRDGSSRWFDLVLIFSFAWNGLLLGILSLRIMEKIMFHVFRLKHLFLFPVMWLIALGVYIGRYWRFNSWDVLVNPFQLLGDIVCLFVHPFAHLFPWTMIGCFAVFMTIAYLSIKKMASLFFDRED